MAVKDRSLDPLIIAAARSEFLEHGFQKASLHKIAQLAGITTGALYTRYQNKDDLFSSLIRPTAELIAQKQAPVARLYEKVGQSHSAEDLLNAIRAEEEIYLDLLFRHYDECVLLYCKSGGSSLELQMKQMMAVKSRQTVDFFRSIARREIDFEGIDLIMAQQFSCYREILQRGYSKEKAVSCMKTVDLFLEAGWKAILDQIL